MAGKRSACGHKFVQADSRYHFFEPKSMTKACRDLGSHCKQDSGSLFERTPIAKAVRDLGPHHKQAIGITF